MELIFDHTMKKIWDKWGIALSTACIVHCVLVALVPLLLPAAELLVHSPWVHRLFALFVMVSTPLAFIPGYRRHGVNRVLIQAGVGLILVMAGVFQDGIWSEVLTHSVSILGSVLLVWAHILNIRHSHKHQNCCE